nr:MAG TPA_asm: toxin [Caudoviricetes sp.]
MQLVDAANVQVLQREISLAALCTPADLRHVVELDSAHFIEHVLASFLVFTRGTDMLEWIKVVAPYIVAIIGLLGGIWVAARNNKNQLTAAYFDRMTAAYEQHWKAFSEFVYEPNDTHRNAYIVALYNARLYASDDVDCGIQILFEKAVEYTSSGRRDIRELDVYAGELEKLLQEDVVKYRSRKRRSR